MSATETPAATSSGPGKKRRQRAPARSPAPENGSREARRLAAVILEVLSGARGPSDAAAAVGISQPRYYALEARALGGFVSALEPRAAGRRRTPEAEVVALGKEIERLRRECARYQALLRASQRTVGVAAPPPKPPEKGRRRRRPVARALRAARALQSDPPSSVVAHSGEKEGAEV